MKQNDDIALELDLGKYLGILKTNWKKLILWMAGAFVLGCLIAIGIPRKYQVVSKIAPELSSTATNRLSTMAALTGFSSAVLGSTDAVYPMVYPDLVKSPEFVADLFPLPVKYLEKGEVVESNLYDYVLNHHSSSWIGFLMSLPGRLISWAAGLFSSDDEGDELGEVDPFHFTRKQGAVYRALCKRIETAIDKKTLVVTTVVTMPDAEICAEVSKAVNENLQKYVTAYRTEKALHDEGYYEKLCEEAKQDYYDAQRKYSSYVDRNQGIVLQSVKVEEERLRNEMNLQYQLYNSMSQQLQSAKAKVQQETPVFAEIIPPTVPLKSANSRKKVALAFALLGLVAGCIVTLVKNLKEEGEQ